MHLRKSFINSDANHPILPSTTTLTNYNYFLFPSRLFLPPGPFPPNDPKGHVTYDYE